MDEDFERPYGPQHLAVRDQLRSWLEVAQIVARTRIEGGLTQKQVAALAGTKQSRISEIESMRGNVRFDTLDRVARALGLMISLRVATPYVPFTVASKQLGERTSTVMASRHGQNTYAVTGAPRELDAV